MKVHLFIFLWIVVWLTCCDSQHDFSLLLQEVKDKLGNVTKLLNSTNRLFLLMGRIINPQILRGKECWTTKKADESKLGIYHHLRYREQLDRFNSTWKTFKFDAFYYVGPKNKTPTVLAYIYEKGTHMKYASGDYTIHYADDKCFVVGTCDEGVPRCGVWVTTKTVDSNNTNCVQAFNSYCGTYGDTVYHVNKTLCRFYKPLSTYQSTTPSLPAC